MNKKRLEDGVTLLGVIPYEDSFINVYFGNQAVLHGKTLKLEKEDYLNTLDSFLATPEGQEYITPSQEERLMPFENTNKKQTESFQSIAQRVKKRKFTFKSKVEKIEEKVVPETKKEIIEEKIVSETEKEIKEEIIPEVKEIKEPIQKEIEKPKKEESLKEEKPLKEKVEKPIKQKPVKQKKVRKPIDFVPILKTALVFIMVAMVSFAGYLMYPKVKLLLQNESITNTDNEIIHKNDEYIYELLEMPEEVTIDKDNQKIKLVNLKDNTVSMRFILTTNDNEYDTGIVKPGNIVNLDIYKTSQTGEYTIEYTIEFYDQKGNSILEDEHFTQKITVIKEETND